MSLFVHKKDQGIKAFYCEQRILCGDLRLETWKLFEVEWHLICFIANAEILMRKWEMHCTASLKSEELTKAFFHFCKLGSMWRTIGILCVGLKQLVRSLMTETKELLMPNLSFHGSLKCFVYLRKNAKTSKSCQRVRVLKSQRVHRR